VVVPTAITGFFAWPMFARLSASYKKLFSRAKHTPDAQQGVADASGLHGTIRDAVGL
jgi:hypothetical protein